MKDTIKTYGQASNYLGVKRERPYAHNTRLERKEDVIFVKYHGNPVVAFMPDGEVIFSSCGWRTLTTKERINWFLPDGFRLYQERSTWYISEYMNRSWVFADGISIKDGQVMNAAPDDEQAEIKAKVKAIKRYVTGFVNKLLAGEMNQPSGGDCWYCLMKDEQGNPIGNMDHIDSHMEESYYVPSLLMNAEKFTGRMSMLAKDGTARLMENESISDWQKSIVARDVKSVLTAYLKHCLGIAQ